MEATITSSVPRVPWTKGKLIPQKRPLKLTEIWAIRIRLRRGARTRNLAMFNLAIDSKLRTCDLTKLRVRDVGLGSRQLRVDRQSVQSGRCTTCNGDE